MWWGSVWALCRRSDGEGGEERGEVIGVVGDLSVAVEAHEEVEVSGLVAEIRNDDEREIW
jgi:hypothetical protein